MHPVKTDGNTLTVEPNPSPAEKLAEAIARYAGAAVPLLQHSLACQQWDSATPQGTPTTCTTCGKAVDPTLREAHLCKGANEDGGNA